MPKYSLISLFLLLLSPPVLGQSTITWSPLQEGMERARTMDQPVLIYVQAPWCGVCKKMEEEVFPESIEALTSFVLTGIDLSDHESRIQLGKRALSPFEWARFWGVEASPGFIVLEPTGEKVMDIVGYLDISRFNTFLDYARSTEVQRGDFIAEKRATDQATGSIRGSVVADGSPVPFANIAVKGTTIGAAADQDGTFIIEGVPVGTHQLMAASVGFKTAKIALQISSRAVEEVTFSLQESIEALDGIMVTGTLLETFVKDSPVKVNVVSPHYLEKIPTANVMEVLENVNGLYQQIDCGVCGTNNIRINGMDGPYTAVLIDGMPIMSSLASVYGLNGISPSLLQQVEIVKGPMSTIYGSEAMGGVINIITKNPQTAPRIAVNSFGSGDGEYALDVGIVPSRGRINSMVSGTFFYNDRFHDENDDNFADLVLNTRFSIFSKLAITDKLGLKKASLSARYYFEDRIGGTEEFIRDFSDALRGSDQIYGETIRTSRLELVGSLMPFQDKNDRLDLAFNAHDQDSYYGANSYVANQTTLFAQYLSPITLNNKHQIQIGAAIRYQLYDDNTGATGRFDTNNTQITNQPDKRVIPGVFTQHEYLSSDKLRFLTGLRVDYQGNHGLIASPRFSIRTNPGKNTTIRLNGGTGFRIVNLFTEDHAAYTGARATVLIEDLKPERSMNGTLSLQHIFQLGYSPLTVDLDGFYTYFTNKIEPDYTYPGLIQYANLPGSATTRGLSITLTQNLLPLNINYTIGGTYMDVFTEEDGLRSPLEFAPVYQGIANVSYSINPLSITLDYTMNLTGPMQLPKYEAPFERATTSPVFSIHNLQVTRAFTLRSGDLLQTYIAWENIFDYTQPTPLIDPQNPFGDHFDTAYVYGPIHGGHVGFGIRYMVRK